VAPRRDAELRPADHAGQVFAGSGVPDAPIQPVGSCLAHGVGSERPVGADRQVGEDYGPVLGEPVGIDEHAALAGGQVAHVEDRLILKAGVAGLEPPPAPLERRTRARVVGELGDPGSQGLPSGSPGEERVGEPALLIEPGHGLGIVGVLEPTIRVRDCLALVVVDGVALASVWVADGWSLPPVLGGGGQSRRAVAVRGADWGPWRHRIQFGV